MKEEFLHFLWKNMVFNEFLLTTHGDPLVIIRPGEVNHDAGPDFINSRVRIGSTIWAGFVEIHVCSSDWYKHGHQFDEKYDNIILHVVYQNDEEIYRSSGEPIPTLELLTHINKEVYQKYAAFLKSRGWIPCANLINRVDTTVISDWLCELSEKRMRKKAARIEKTLVLNNQDWEQATYQLVASGFGFKLNTLPFELLAKSLPCHYLKRHKNDPEQTEALLFGQAGLLSGTFRESYPNMLKKEYLHLKRSYNLHPIRGHLWNFLRLRPSNFPTIRLSQFANLIVQAKSLHKEILRITNTKEIHRFLDIQCSPYWESHYMFDAPSRKKNKKMGRQSIELLTINTIIPILYAYGKLKNVHECITQSRILLAGLPPEKNNITRKFEEAGVRVGNASESQGLLYLKSEFCDQKKCLDCPIGQSLCCPDRQGPQPPA